MERLLTIEPYPKRRKTPSVKAKKGSRKRVKKENVSTLMKEADRLFSLKVRSIKSPQLVLGMADYMGPDTNQCFTCEKFFSAKKLQCGHYLSRFYKATRWDFDNARPQCMMCNMWKRGDLVVYRQNLIKEIGIERVEAVEAKRQISFKLTKEYLKEIILDLVSSS